MFFSSFSQKQSPRNALNWRGGRNSLLHELPAILRGGKGRRYLCPAALQRPIALNYHPGGGSQRPWQFSTPECWILPQGFAGAALGRFLGPEFIRRSNFWP